ncbi:YjbF family lipoprotein [Alkalimonas collagenimarina]|uniref:YjbF family lipoprotein n=1 Tax=Alkalimonas collagenimarina TaxID=400390 RepID=A0ABT9H1Z4_9GAMM|nr:YjbF family lipoprotein [Alkalimonas collagenimarina]MDP4536920.1 YjbF family lipoprotein [Alkalimonas collagenimarina]
MKRFFFRLIAVSGLASMVLACGGTPRVYYNDLKTAFSTTPDVELTLDQVQSSSYDLLYVRVNDGPRVALTLAFLEHGQHKWVSADSAVLVLEQGRLVRSANFTTELNFVSNTHSDPLKQGPDQLAQAASWLRLVDWGMGASGYAMESGFREVKMETLQLFEQAIPTRVFVETVHLPDIDKSFQNYFWFDAQSGLLVKSEQQLTHQGPTLEFTYISPLARQLKMVIESPSP